MSELKIQAPLARIEDWVEYDELQSAEDFENSNKDTFPSPETNENSIVDGCFSDQFSTSLEDLVNTFDENITKCFYDYEENVEKLAPIQIRNPDDIMNECQIWWTLTGNFGNILPIDWTKACSKGLQQALLNMNCNKAYATIRDTPINGSNHDCFTAKNTSQQPTFTAEKVLEEIEEIIHQQRSSSLDEEQDDVKAKVISYVGMYKDEVRRLTVPELQTLVSDLEQLIREHSQILIDELAKRDELDYEKELKNTFVSLLVGVHNRRQSAGGNCKYLNTVIPYNPKQGSPSNLVLQILIKILQAINDDTPTVPTLLTDYILKVFCPT